MSLTVETVQAALKGLIDPNTKIDFVTSKSVKNLRVDGGDVSLDIVLGYPAKSQFDAIRKSVIAVLRELPEVRNVSVNVSSQIVANSVQRGVKLLHNVKNIIVDSYSLKKKWCRNVKKNVNKFIIIDDGLED